MKNNLIDLLATLVSMPTITSDIQANEQALDYIEGYLKKRGMHTKRYQIEGHGALMASTRANNHFRHTVLLSTHNDVASGSEELFTIREANGILYGRGVYDMKSATAGYMQVVDDLYRAGTLDHYDFAIQVTTDEEFTPGYDRSGVANLIRKGYQASIVILPDSTAPGWDIEKIAKGWWRFDLIATGTSVHSGRPWEGDSASIKLIHALHELKELFKNHGPLTDSLNIGSIHGTDTAAYNKVPDKMVAMVEIRLSDDQSSARNEQLIKALCKRHGLAYKTFSLVQPVHPILDSPLVHAFKETVERVTGKSPKGHISLGGSDAPYFTNAGIPCVLSCPLGGKHHSEKEWVDKASLLQLVPILHDYLEHNAKMPAVSVDKHAAVV
ncbi:MAG TPA: M20 family metallopeptidase [Bacillota bacterium]|nr:M20 family metallopeptidase [Bacillota bacterium]